MKEVYLSQRLATDSDRFHLSCLCDKKNKPDKQFIWLEFTKIKDKEYPNQLLTWDNPSYLFKTFYTYLEHRLIFKVTKKEIEEFKDISDYLDVESTSELLGLLNTAIKLKWY